MSLKGFHTYNFGSQILALSGSRETFQMLIVEDGN